MQIDGRQIDGAATRYIFARSRHGRPSSLFCLVLFSFTIRRRRKRKRRRRSRRRRRRRSSRKGKRKRRKRKAVEIRCSIDSPIDDGSSNYPIQFNDNDRRWPPHIFFSFWFGFSYLISLNWSVFFCLGLKCAFMLAAIGIDAMEISALSEQFQSRSWTRLNQILLPMFWESVRFICDPWRLLCFARSSALSEHFQSSFRAGLKLG